MAKFLVHTADGKDHIVNARSFDGAERQVRAKTKTAIRMTTEMACLAGLRVLDRQISGAPMRRASLPSRI
ncbi:MAG: hypothetical protein WC026_17175 [Hyphomicrobium sp.]|uniref:hypothetical protein n=1 Tax=Hyphomicrobium sp. TaxID=82 RepID=UPI003569A883